MADKSWKRFERECAKDIGTQRIPDRWRVIRKYDKLPPSVVGMYRAGLTSSDIGFLFGVNKKIALGALRYYGQSIRQVNRTDVDAHIDKNAPGGCWLWRGGKDAKGYGSVQVEGKESRVHRLVYERHKGPIPVGLVLDHLCRNKGCVNPDHLEPVTNAVNCQRGSKAKVTPEIVRAIRSDWVPRKVSQQSLANRYGIHVETVRSILKRETWANV